MAKRAASSTSRRVPRRRLGVLFTCVGKRVELLKAFRSAAKRLNVELTIHAADMSWFAPAMHVADRAHIVPSLGDSNYINALLELVKKNGISLVIPLIDTELEMMSQAWSRFDRIGARVVVSSENVIQTCTDKVLTFEKLKVSGIDTPETWLCADVLRRKRHRFPYFLKPRAGSAGQGNHKIESIEELRVLRRHVTKPIVQEFVDGTEYTLDVYTGLDGIPRCVVPRKRIEVRAGEVSKSVTVKNRRIMAIGQKVALALGDCRGVITVQCITTRDGRMRVIEINPRFGGGVPLAIHARADFPRWLMAEHLGRRITIDPTGFRNNVYMLRYDESVFYTPDRRRGK